MMKRDWLWVALIISVLLLNVFLATIVNSQRTTDISADPLVVHDTIRIVEPTPAADDTVRCDTASFPIVKELERNEQNEPKCHEMTLGNEQNEYLDGPSNGDSAKVVIPISERTYEDSTYKAVVRGYNPELVSLDIYNTIKYYPVVEKVKVKPKVVVSAGVYGGFGVKGADYGLGIMVGVPIWSW